MNENERQSEKPEVFSADEGSREEEGKEVLPAGERMKRSVLEWTETIVMAIVMVAVAFTFIVRIITVDGGSMQPTYYNGDRVLVSGMTAKVEQGDIVIIINALKEPIIKRVIATEGQTVGFDDSGEVTVDGQVLPGSAFGIENGITSLPNIPGQVLEFPQTVPENCVFVLGDNRANSTDSRYVEVGMVDRRNILGKVVFNVYPFSKAGAIK